MKVKRENLYWIINILYIIYHKLGIYGCGNIYTLECGINISPPIPIPRSPS